MQFWQRFLHQLYQLLLFGGLILGSVMFWKELILVVEQLFPQSVFWSGVNDFLWLPGEAIFHFLPVGITWSITRKMGTTQILGIILGDYISLSTVVKCLFCC